MAAATMLRIEKFLIVTLLDNPTSNDVDDLLDIIGEQIVAHASRGVVIDASALSMVDSYLARILGSLVAAARLLGAEAILAGMRPEVAIALVELGTDLPNVSTALNLDFAIADLRRGNGARV
jgi:rsbT antagonist protein RsbS